MQLWFSFLTRHTFSNHCDLFLVSQHLFWMQRQIAHSILAKYFLWTKTRKNRQKSLMLKDFPVPFLLCPLASHWFRSETRLFEFERVKVPEVLEHSGGRERQWDHRPLCALEMSDVQFVNDSFQQIWVGGEASSKASSLKFIQIQNDVQGSEKHGLNSEHRHSSSWGQSTAVYEKLQTLKVLHDCANHSW